MLTVSVCLSVTLDERALEPGSCCVVVGELVKFSMFAKSEALHCLKVFTFLCCFFILS